MNFRNGIKSIVRTPVRTGLFLLLITAITVFLFLSLNTWSTSNAILRDSDKVFTTIVSFKYRDVGGSGEGYLTRRSWRIWKASISMPLHPISM